MLDYDLMYKMVNPAHLEFSFCLDSAVIATRSLRHRALVNATLQAKFPASSKMTLSVATAQGEDALRAAARAPGRPGTPACADAADAGEAPSAASTAAARGDAPN